MDTVQVVKQYLSAYQSLDYKTMDKIMAPEFVFEDPAFPHLEGKESRGMFRMFIAGAARQDTAFAPELDNVRKGNSDNEVIARYVATYNFGEGRRVTNVIDSLFTMEKIDGEWRIAMQQDSFDFGAWSTQALGMVGYLASFTGWTTSLLQGSVQGKAKARLAGFFEREEKSGAQSQPGQ